jgi:hypothetical protein
MQGLEIIMWQKQRKRKPKPRKTKTTTEKPTREKSAE